MPTKRKVAAECDTTAQTVSRTLQALADAEIAKHSQRFFKTGPGEYGEGDQFLGIRVPALRAQVKHFRGTPLTEILKLLQSVYHEQRLCALLMLVDSYRRGDERHQTRIYTQYLKHTRYINNWDLVDSSAYHIVGSYLLHRDRKPLYSLCASDDLWRRRIAVIATFHFIQLGQFDDTLKLAERLLDDPQDLIHKAVGWMLREIGKRDLNSEKRFLDDHYQHMPRTMLRYAIEKFPEDLRQAYLRGDA